MLRPGLINEGIETTGANVSFDLPIPKVLLERCEPLAEATKLVGRELADSSLDLFNAAHALTLPPDRLCDARDAQRCCC